MRNTLKTYNFGIVGGNPPPVPKLHKVRFRNDHPDHNRKKFTLWVPEGQDPLCFAFATCQDYRAVPWRYTLNEHPIKVRFTWKEVR